MTLLERYRDARMPLEELVTAAGRLIRKLGLEATDGRVSPELDSRTVRYYQTIGLLDKPNRFEGRRAIYGFRHLLQLACLKRLQAERYPLALIQEALTGRSTSQLETSIREVCSLPQDPPTPPAQAQLVAAEVAPGVTIVIDPEFCDNKNLIILHCGSPFVFGLTVL